MDKKGKLIIVEGLDGCGKDTQIDMIVERLNNENIKTVKRTNVSDSPVGKAIREILSGSNPEYVICNRQLAALFIAELHIVAREIKSQLEQGINVICSRWFTSTLAYAGKTESEFRDILHMGCTDTTTLYKDESDVFEDYQTKYKMDKFEVEPDFFIYLDIDPEEALNRINSRNESKEIYEDIEKLEVIKELYTKVLVTFCDTYEDVVLDAEDTVENIHNNIYINIKELLSE
jgi:dTMP kinase